MNNTNLDIEKESNTILSKLSEEQFYWLRNVFWGWKFDGFYPTLNTKLLTKIREDFKKNAHKVDLTEDEFISIVKDYGSVSHHLVVDGDVILGGSSLSDFLPPIDISAEKVAEIGVDEIEKWGSRNRLYEVEDYLKSHSIIDEDEYSSSLERIVIEQISHPRFEPEVVDIEVNKVRVVTMVDIYSSLPEPEELLPEKLVA